MSPWLTKKIDQFIIEQTRNYNTRSLEVEDRRIMYGRGISIVVHRGIVNVWVLFSCLPTEGRDTGQEEFVDGEPVRSRILTCEVTTLYWRLSVWYLIHTCPEWPFNRPCSRNLFLNTPYSMDLVQILPRVLKECTGPLPPRWSFSEHYVLHVLSPRSKGPVMQHTSYTIWIPRLSLFMGRHWFGVTSLEWAEIFDGNNGPATQLHDTVLSLHCD